MDWENTFAKQAFNKRVIFRMNNRLLELNIISSQGNANQNHKEISFYHYQESYNFKKRKISFDKETGTLMCCQREPKMVQPLWKSLVAFSKMKTQKYHMTQLFYSQVCILGMYPKELKAGTQTDNYYTMFIAALFTTVKRQK